jgi:hypothetical protein
VCALLGLFILLVTVASIGVCPNGDCEEHIVPRALGGNPASCISQDSCSLGCQEALVVFGHGQSFVLVSKLIHNVPRYDGDFETGSEMSRSSEEFPLHGEYLIWKNEGLFEMEGSIPR